MELDSWRNSLPDSLFTRQDIDSAHSHVLCLHILYWSITLRLYFPIYRQARSDGQDSKPDTENQFVKLCNRATEELLQLFSEFDKRYSSKYLPRTLLQAIVICGDALILERNRASKEAPKVRANAQEGIELCICTLRVAGETWPHATNLAVRLQARAAM
ncbi:unnamed protein product [Rhizoctonia solani]|uniref:Transcription factor domain-containing protein n=1 Tax=Rhizoctonia solani TaxID=456999 RepID=A0A8H2WNC6_9AGAM|nr:unnamed protein product [Rhizoctonia solani]